MRQAVVTQSGMGEFHFTQYLFACQARILLELGRPYEVIPAARLPGLHSFPVLAISLPKLAAPRHLPCG